MGDAVATSDENTIADGLVSPLRKVDRPVIFRSKSEALISRVFGGEALTTHVSGEPTSESEDVEGFFATLFVLRVHVPLIERLAGAATESELTRDGPVRRNVSRLFCCASSRLADERTDETTRDRIVDTLSPMLNELLNKSGYSSFAHDVMVMLAGSLDHSDAAFTDFVTGLDVTIGDVALPVDLRHRALKLALNFACAINQRAVNSYFLRRGGLFGTLVQVIGDPSTQQMAFEASTLLSVLANFSRFETRNPFLQRLEDLVDDGVMTTIISTLRKVLHDLRQGYIDVVDDAAPTFMASLTSLFASVFGIATAFATPRPVPRYPEASDQKVKPPVVTDESKFGELPDRNVVALLPLYDLLHANEAFGALLLAELTASASGPAPPPFLAIFVSFASYLFCHASVSSRSRVSARLSLLILTMVVDAGPAFAGPECAVEVRLCRQRLPALPFANDQRRPLIAGILDSVVCFVRHNIRTALDIDSQMSVVRIALQLAHRCMYSLKTARIRLDYDWSPLWRAVLSLTAFIAARKDHFSSSPRIGSLVDAILTLLDFACVWIPTIGSSSDTATALFFEVLRAQAAIFDIGTWATSLGRDTSTGKPASATDECLRNLRAVVSHFGDPIAKQRAALGEFRHLDPPEVLAIIGANEESLDLEDSPALEDVRPYDESEHVTFLRELMRTACADLLVLDRNGGTPRRSNPARS